MPSPFTLAVLAPKPSDLSLAGRAARLWRPAEVELPPRIIRTAGGLADLLAGADGPLIVQRAGAWLASPAPLPESFSPWLLGLGAVRSGEGTSAWDRCLARCGGDLAALPWWARLGGGRALPACASVLFGPESARLAAACLRRRPSLETALGELIFHASAAGRRRVRAVRLHALDVHFDRRPRVLQAITSIQRGGAERVCLDLAAELPALGVPCAVAALGRPGRAAWPEPANFARFAPGASGGGDSPVARAEFLHRTAAEFGADVVHGHLLRGDEARAVRALGWPVVLTIHNDRPGWPAEFDFRQGVPALADLLLGCGSAITDALVQEGFEAASPVRTLLNGVDPASLPTAQRAGERARRRAEWGFGNGDLVLLSVANPRPQKCLELLPAVLDAVNVRLEAGGETRRARLVLAGSAAARLPNAAESEVQLKQAIAQSAARRSIRRLGDAADVRSLLAAADVLVCASAHEGLSLAWLEALREGVPVVSTAVGAAGEVAALQPAGAFRCVPAGAAPEVFAAEILRATAPGQARPTLHRGLTRRKMAGRAALFYGRAAVRSARKTPPRGLWIVINNLSLGGAQSSARRLLLALATRGVPVRCSVVQEDPARPSVGRRALLDAGLPVHAVPPSLPAGRTAAGLLAQMDADPPAAVLFWNLLPSLRVLLADLWLDAAPIFDVSPGEMSFDALESWFGQSPAPGGLPYSHPQRYGTKLRGVVVKWSGEAGRAARLLGCSVHVIPNGVPLPLAPAPRPLLEVDASRPLMIGTAARLSPDKRLEEIIEGFRLALPGMPRGSRLLIAGSAQAGNEQYARELHRRARGMPVVFLGRVEDIDGFHRRLDVFAMGSRPAGCPNASLEAMASGLPVVATDWGGASEQMVHGESGLVVPDADPAAFAEALAALAGDAAARRRLAIAARARAAAFFSVERMCNDYLRLCLPEEARAATESNAPPAAAFVSAAGRLSSAAA